MKMSTDSKKYWNCFDVVYEARPKIGALIRPSIINFERKSVICFPHIDGSRWVNVEPDDVMTFLGIERVDIPDYLHGTCEIETRYKFLINEQIVYSVDPGRKDIERSFNWLFIPC